MKLKDFELTVGIEFHVELATLSKMFCSCSSEIWNEPPNSHVCPVCLGLPGAMPVANREAVKKAILLGMAFNCKPQASSKFDRKNYFYPDLPKGFQISQYEFPFSKDGFAKVGGLKIGITRVHLEEDTGKLIHLKGATLIDFNRSGMPLVEIVSEPDITTSREANDFAQKVQQIVRYTGVSEADMEKGSMRVEANISVRKLGGKKFGTKVEVKNLNSFRSVERAINYEFTRQVELIKKGGKVIQETRGWNEVENKTYPQRTKEFAHDYRYFPEPDLLPFYFEETFFQKLKRGIGELPDLKKERFIKNYGLSNYDAELLTSTSQLSSWYEEALLVYSKKPTINQAKIVANWVIGELLRRLKQTEKSLDEISITPAYLVEILYLLDEGKITQVRAKDVFWQIFQTGERPQSIINKLSKVVSEKDLQDVVDEVIAKNKEVVKELKSGKTQIMNFLLGQVMKKTSGGADPKLVERLLKERV